MDVQPLVSIIIPAYNVKKYVARTIDSILAQTCGNFELLLVDDGSTDGTRSILNAYAGKDKRIRILKQKNSGAAAARNRAINEARGRFLYFMDADDLIKPELLSVTTAAAEATNADVVLFRAVNCTEDESYISPNPYGLYLRDSQRQPVLSKMDLNENIFQLTPPSVWNKLFRRSLVERTRMRFQEQHNTNDLAFAYTCLACAERVAWLETPLYIYRVSRRGSLTLQKAEHFHCVPDALVCLKEELLHRDEFERVEASYNELVRITLTRVLRDKRMAEVPEEARQQAIDALGYRGRLCTDGRTVREARLESGGLPGKLWTLWYSFREHGIGYVLHRGEKTK